eukprot:CAMPEP_0201546994 /NCGR_PEP_ID=MMETSP0173_2-20130828/3397_1 /ASSEMBLY_ACC=CAM_ASM_000268 /TAXON_ID=218659 /ORGANISM="Vexillifera sp., Strain DIVA3 564/2" /LENGTH=243 /DNA_ID=CAMNT_0047955869 /DNA_START=18 /DNA_END=749 /DNA_ORIENTATION=+
MTSKPDDIDTVSLTFDPSKKKKKKKKKTTRFALDDTKDDDLLTPNFGSKKKKKTKKATSDASDATSSSTDAASSSTQNANPADGDEPDYTYGELVDRIFKTLETKNPEMMNRGGDRRIRVPPPEVGRDGTRRTVWSNFARMCDAINRSKEHLQAYALAELGTEGTLDADYRLTIKGRFQPKQIQTVVRHYIGEYVICKTCKSSDTSLRKENRMYFLACAHCGSTRSVAAIKAGYVAQVGRRKR